MKLFSLTTSTREHSHSARLYSRGEGGAQGSSVAARRADLWKPTKLAAQNFNTRIGFDRLCSKSSIICHLQCSYISKIMPIIMLVFVNYAHFSKICRNYASTFYFKFGKNTSIAMQKSTKWQTHLPFLQLGTLRVHYHDYSFSENYKNSSKNQHTDAILLWVGEQVSYAHALSPVGPWSYEIQSDNKQLKKLLS